MPCMCGDTYCPSCGPAQGNYKCYNCGKWSEDGGCDNPKLCEETLRKIDEEEYKQLAEIEKQAEEYWKKEGK